MVLRISNTTETTIKTLVPPIAKEETPVKPEIIDGRIATNPRKLAPTKVIRVKTKFR